MSAAARFVPDHAPLSHLKLRTELLARIQQHPADKRLSYCLYELGRYIATPDGSAVAVLVLWDYVLDQGLHKGHFSERQLRIRLGEAPLTKALEKANAVIKQERERAFKIRDRWSLWPWELLSDGLSPPCFGNDLLKPLWRLARAGCPPETAKALLEEVIRKRTHIKANTSYTCEDIKRVMTSFLRTGNNQKRAVHETSTFKSDDGHIEKRQKTEEMTVGKAQMGTIAARPARLSQPFNSPSTSPDIERARGSVREQDLADDPMSEPLDQEMDVDFPTVLTEEDPDFIAATSLPTHVYKAKPKRKIGQEATTRGRVSAASPTNRGKLRSAPTTSFQDTGTPPATDFVAPLSRLVGVFVPGNATAAVRPADSAQSPLQRRDLLPARNSPDRTLETSADNPLDTTPQLIACLSALDSYQSVLRQRLEQATKLLRDRETILADSRQTLQSIEDLVLEQKTLCEERCRELETWAGFAAGFQSLKAQWSGLVGSREERIEADERGGEPGEAAVANGGVERTAENVSARSRSSSATRHAIQTSVANIVATLSLIRVASSEATRRVELAIETKEAAAAAVQDAEQRVDEVRKEVSRRALELKLASSAIKMVQNSRTIIEENHV